MNARIEGLKIMRMSNRSSSQELCPSRHLHIPLAFSKGRRRTFDAYVSNRELTLPRERKPPCLLNSYLLYE